MAKLAVLTGVTDHTRSFAPDERLLAHEPPELRAALEAEATRIARRCRARTAADFARLGELAERLADDARGEGRREAEANGRALAAIFRRRARELGLN